MKYDPIKDIAASAIAVFPALRVCFYKALDLLLLRQRYVKREILRYGKPAMRFYDAGAGFCQYGWFVLNKFPDSIVFATDLKTEYLRSFSAVAGRRFSYKSADLQQFRPETKYDMAIAIDILEHIEDDISTLQNFHYALKDGGILIISSPSDLDEAAKFTEEHVRPGYNKNELEQKLMDAGFEIVTSSFSYGYFGAISWKLMMKYPLLMLKKHKILALILPLYYMVVYPFSELLMQADLKRKNTTGTGLIVVARKMIDRIATL